MMLLPSLRIYNVLYYDAAPFSSYCTIRSDLAALVVAGISMYPAAVLVRCACAPCRLCRHAHAPCIQLQAELHPVALTLPMLQAQNLSQMRAEYEERYREKENEMLEVLLAGAGSLASLLPAPCSPTPTCSSPANARV